MGARIPSGSQATANPTLAFRLDPGEPGVLRRAPASQSTLRVAEQEGRNTRRLEAAARRDGRIVTRSVRQFTRGNVGGFTTTTAGRTTVESVAPRPTATENAIAIADARETFERDAAAPAPAPERDGGEGGVSGLSGAGGAGLFNRGFRFANPDTAQVERNLIVQQTAIERALIDRAGPAGELDDPEVAAAARRELADLRQQAEQIEQQINRIRLARLAEDAQRITRSLLGAAEAQVQTASRNAVEGAAGGVVEERPDEGFFSLIA